MSNEPEREERFVLHELLGTGASGSVHRAFDRQRGNTVALKLLTQTDPASLVRFKGEFRALTDIAHPNLVQLYDLIMRDDAWLLTMELIEGGDFLRYVRPGPASIIPPGAATLLDEELDGATISNEYVRAADGLTDVVEASRASEHPRTVPEPSPQPGPATLPRRLGPLDEVRLRASLRQLAEGLAALHRASFLHRDLKPANVLVRARDGHVAICDFGLVADSGSQRGAGERGRKVAGTLAYMSPEQAQALPLSEASDWYAVGVMLYQALTGTLPFSSRLSYEDAVLAKERGVVVHPGSVAAEAPADLSDLALALLCADPTRRAGHAEVLACLGSLRSAHSLAPTGRVPLVGRVVQREQLDAALARARAGRPTVALVGGRSGMGKSALLQQFTQQAAARHGALVLAGRCYEREELPYKAFDPLLDALGTHLMQVDDVQAERLMPSHVSALARLFPSLRRVPAISRALGRSAIIDPLELKRRAFAALRELCTSLAELRPLVLYIDDLQWGDLESAPLFQELLHAPGAPALLLVCAYRSEDEERSPLLKELRRLLSSELAMVPVEVRVEALSDEESAALARTVLGSGTELEPVAAWVAREGGGSPFFVRELAMHARVHGGRAHEQLRLDSLIAARIEALPSDSRALLSLTAAAGRPERRRVLQTASALGEQGLGALRVLESHNFVHSTGAEADDRVEAYHDRVRETAYRMLDEPERRRLHRALALALVDAGERDAETLFEHWRRSDEPEHAGGFALEAASNAEGQLAFARAARLLEAALELLPLDAHQRRSIEERRGNCLALSGHGAEAAAAFSRALVGASPEQAMRLHGVATAELLRAGRVAEAYTELDRAHALTGLRVPKSNWSALRMLLWRRLQIFFRRLRLRPGRKVAPAELLQRTDMLWNVGSSLVSTDTLRGAVYQSEHLLVALRANDPYRLARAMSVEAVLSATQNRDGARTQYFIDRGLEYGGLSGEAHALSTVKGTAGVCRLLEGRFREAVQLTREGQTIVRERLNATMTWDLLTLTIFELQATAHLGNVAEISTRVSETLRDAEQRGDIYATTSCRTLHCIWAWLGPDQVDEARRQLNLASSQWVQEGYHLQHWYITQARADVDLYADAPDESLARLEAEWDKLFYLRQIQFTRVEVLYLRGRLKLAKARQGFDDKLLRDARRDAQALIREGAHWASALGRQLLACAASFDEPDECLLLLTELEGQFDALDMRLHQQVARYRRGQLMRGDGATGLVASAEAAIRGLGVTRPEAFVAMLAPGFPTMTCASRESHIEVRLHDRPRGPSAATHR